MPKHIGIVGCSAEGAALCYSTICLEAEPLMGKHAHPEVTMHHINQIIFDELVRGIRSQESLLYFQQVTDEDSPLPTLDSTRASRGRRCGKHWHDKNLVSHRRFIFPYLNRYQLRLLGGGTEYFVRGAGLRVAPEINN